MNLYIALVRLYDLFSADHEQWFEQKLHNVSIWEHKIDSCKTMQREKH